MSSTQGSPIGRDRYDVVIAGARCAGASTAMLLARQGLRVLVVDPTSHGSDTLSTHGLMRGGVLQLHRWGVLDAVRAAQTPTIRTTTFHYGDEVTEVAIKERDGIDGLYAPRRTVLDAILVDAALAAGAEVVHGRSVVDVLRAPDGRVRGASITGADRQVIDVAAELVIGADGVRSRVARILQAEPHYTVAHTTASIYGYQRALGLEGFHWCIAQDEMIETLLDLLTGDDDSKNWADYKNFIVVAIKPFMDAHTFDQDRVDRCCVHIVDRSGQPVSFCEYNAVRRPRGQP